MNSLQPSRTSPTRTSATRTRRSASPIDLRLKASDPRGLPTIFLFQRGLARLQSGYQDALRRHILYLQAFGHSSPSFVIRGHANLRTNEPNAVVLSMQRAKVVANCLRDLGVPANNIKIMARGSDQGWDVEMGGRSPLKWNRRVELEIHLGRRRVTSDSAAKP